MARQDTTEEWSGKGLYEIKPCTVCNMSWSRKLNGKDHHCFKIHMDWAVTRQDIQAFIPKAKFAKNLFSRLSTPQHLSINKPKQKTCFIWGGMSQPLAPSCRVQMGRHCLAQKCSAFYALRSAAGVHFPVLIEIMTCHTPLHKVWRGPSSANNYHGKDMEKICSTVGK